MKRRDFLFSIASAVPVAATLSGVAFAGSTPRAVRVGLMLPATPDLERQFLAGWREASAVTPTVSARVGAGHGDAAQTVQAWLEGNRVDVIVSALSAHGARVRSLAEAHGVPIFVADFGANWSRAGSALVVRQGLHMAEGAYALGQHAARTGSRSAVVVTSSFDAGFDHVRAFTLGFESADGRVLETMLLDSSAVPWQPQRLHAVRPDAVFVAASSALSLKDFQVPLGTRVLAGGLAPWLLPHLSVETALATDATAHPAFALGLEAGRTLHKAHALVQSGLHVLPALLQARTIRPLERLELRGGRVVHRSDLEDASAFEPGVQMLTASRTSGYSNAYPVL